VDTSLTWTIAGLAAAVVGVVIPVWTFVVSARAAPRQEAEERQRLSREVFGVSAVSAGRNYTNTITYVPLEAEAPPHAEAPPQGQAPAEVPPTAEILSSRDARYDQLLINDYALGLTQARRAFNASMSFSILGGMVLVLGVSLAIFRAATGGQVAGAAITSAAGVLTSGLSQLFRGQSTKALKHLETQAVELRKDVRARTNAVSAQRLLGEVSDVHLRSRLQAALILEFTGATLPDVGSSSQPRTGNLDGSVSSHEGIEPSSPSS
jgi:hypothetical protein